ncbi:hypothetical protein [Paenibacillus sp. P22]|uniref:hypothetical protein n=1 Tax=Paenibacillus sp. P22 TaxID=483908 RepID=UPI0004358DD9|nr:hypothetical protein [Paenibacillus sp. P22]CDN46102.1 hypothetical protein BN871_KO_00060 [Paenibacillus sp. P22]
MKAGAAWTGIGFVLALAGLALIVLLLLDAAYIRRKTAHLDLIPEFGALNIYTNTIYANVYHFFIGLVMLHLVLLNTRWGGRKVPSGARSSRIRTAPTAPRSTAAGKRGAGSC